MSGYRIVSSDNHVFEPRDLWTSRVSTKFKDRAPHLVSKEDGDWWYYDNSRVLGTGAGSQAGVRFEDPNNLTIEHTFEEVRPGGYIPEEHVKDLDVDGVDVSIIYPTVGLVLYSVPDSDLLSAMCGIYNDWLAEFCKSFPKRLKGIAMLNVDDVKTGVKELERNAKNGLTGGLITVHPIEGKGYDSPEYEPLWAAAQDLGMPLSLHIATNRPGKGQELASTEEQNTNKISVLANTDHWVRVSICDMICSGVFERYPKLQVGSVEHELSWAPHFLDRIDFTYSQRTSGIYGYRFKEDVLPSDYFHRNVFLGFQEDALGIQLRDIIGVDQMQWGSDYPHAEGTFPKSQQILEDILADCTEEEKAKIAGGNAARVYHLD